MRVISASGNVLKLAFAAAADVAKYCVLAAQHLIQLDLVCGKLMQIAWKELCKGSRRGLKAGRIGESMKRSAGPAECEQVAE